MLQNSVILHFPVILQFSVISWTDETSLRKKFFRSQAQRADNTQILEAWKKLHKPEFFVAKLGRFGNFHMII